MADLVKDMIDHVAVYTERRRVTKEMEWASVLDAVATVRKLVKDHLETAKIMTEPVRIKRDLASTAELLRRFVDEGSLPLAYDEVHGGLEQLIQSGSFKAEATSLMRELRIRLSQFQVEAFMVRYNSWSMADAVESITELVALLKRPDAGSETSVRINELRRLLKEPWDGHPTKNAWQLFRELPSRPSANDDSQVEPGQGRRNDLDCSCLAKGLVRARAADRLWARGNLPSHRCTRKDALTNRRSDRGGCRAARPREMLVRE